MKKGHPKKKVRHKKPGPDTPYEIAHETRALVREIHEQVVGHWKPGGLTPQQVAELQQLGTDMRGVTSRLNAADRDT